MGTLVTFLAISYFASRDVADLVESLKGQDDPRWKLVVLDNSGSDGEYRSLAEIAHAEARVNVLRANANLGYLGGANYALGSGALAPSDWLVVCNADLVYDRDFVRTLLSMSGARVLAPAIISSVSGRDQNPYLVRRPDGRDLARWHWEFKWTPVARIVLMGNHLLASCARLLPSRRAQGAATIYAPHGSCMVFSQNYFAEGGHLMHPVLLFGEEITIGEQCRRLGMPVVYEPSLRLRHNEHGSVGVWRNKGLLRIHREAVEYAAALLRDN